MVDRGGRERCSLCARRHIERGQRRLPSEPPEALTAEYLLELGAALGSLETLSQSP
jgi:hypothetical protein